MNDRRRVFKVGDLVVDAFISEEHTRSTSLTKFPTERGSDVTDHARREPIVVAIDGLVTDSPIGELAVSRASTRLIVPAAAGVGGAALNAARAEQPYSVQARDYLERTWKAGEPIVVETSLGLLRDMVITSLSFPRDSTTGPSLRFSLTVEQIVIVDNARTRVRVAKPRAAGHKKYGAKVAANNTFTEDGIIYYTFGANSVIWRKGEPPGAPLKPGHRQEVLYWAQDPKTSRAYWVKTRMEGGTVDANGSRGGTLKRVPLTNQEVIDFHKDSDRDRRERENQKKIAEAREGIAKLWRESGTPSEPSIQPKFTPAPSPSVFSREALNPNMSFPSTPR